MPILLSHEGLLDLLMAGHRRLQHQGEVRRRIMYQDIRMTRAAGDELNPNLVQIETPANEDFFGFQGLFAL